MSDDVTAKLSRWSQRKLAARRGGALPAEPHDAEAKTRRSDAAGEAPASALERQQPAAAPPTGDTDTVTAPMTDAELSALPPIEGLNFQSDYTVFLAKNVPETLRRAALRKLWVSDPVLANLDGLNDYCEDLNIVDTPITLAQTSYRVGKGYFDEAEEKLEKELLEAGGKPAEARPEQKPCERIASRGGARQRGRR